MLRILTAEVLAELLADATYNPAPVSTPVSGQTGPPRSRPDGSAVDGLPRDRALTATDRVLLCGNLEQPALTAVANRVLACAADVWVLPIGEPAQVPLVIDRLAITLCHAPTCSSAADAPLTCVDATGEPLEAGRTGWLVESGKLPDSALSAGYVDSQRWVHVLGRARDCLPTEHGLLTPFEAVARLESHAFVSQACVLLIPEDSVLASDADRGTSVSMRYFAVAETSEEQSPVLEVELLRFLRRGLSAVKCPQGILLVQSMPRHSGSMPDLVALRELVAKETLC